MNNGRVEVVEALDGTALNVVWRDGSESSAELAGWIATGGEMLSPLMDADIWKTARVADFGATVEWEGDDLAIDAVHLQSIAADQREFDVKDLHRWQEEVGLSNNEAADFLGVSLRTWKNYRTGAPISHAVKMLLRATQRDPLLLHAHYRPRRSGRPKRAA
jgi:DNA-binding transcriptional regulator YiaG